MIKKNPEIYILKILYSYFLYNILKIRAKMMMRNEDDDGQAGSLLGVLCLENGCNVICFCLLLVYYFARS